LTKAATLVVSIFEGATRQNLSLAEKAFQKMLQNRQRHFCNILLLTLPKCSKFSSEQHSPEQGFENWEVNMLNL